MIILLISNIATMNAADISAFLPRQSNEWVASDSDRYYNYENLYDYIDGAAELYISYGFDTVISRRYSSPEGTDIVAEIFDMHEARDAFGVYTNMREKNQHEYGQGSQQVEGSLIFWKDHYFISVSADKNDGNVNAAIKRIAKYIDDAIPGEGKIPDIIGYLPGDNRVEEGYCYFHHYIWLNAYYFIAAYNILDIDEKTDAVIAKYGPPDKRSYLLLVQYPDEETARTAFDKFIKDFAPELKSARAVKLKDNTWHTAQRRGKYIAAVFNAPTRGESIKLQESVKL